MLETHLRGKNEAILGNLRAFPPNGKANEVWNHGIGKYTAKFHPVPGKGERAVRLEIELVANSGSNLNDSDNKPRINTYEYILVYGLDGAVDETLVGQGLADWIAVGGEAIFAPLNLMEVVSSKWQGHNPQVTESNVRGLDMANGGGYSSRLAGTPPAFVPVGSYETGRVARSGRGGLLGMGRDGDGGDMASPPRRGGLFRGLFNR